MFTSCSSPGFVSLHFQQTALSAMTDDDFMRRLQQWRFVSGSFQTVPILISCNSDEGLLQAQPLNTSTQFDAWLESNFPNACNSTLEELKILYLYPSTNDGQPMESFSAPTDYDFSGAIAATGVTCGPYFSVLPPFRKTILLTHEDKKLIKSGHQTISHRTVSCLIHTRHTSLSSIPGLGTRFCDALERADVCVWTASQFHGCPERTLPCCCAD